MSGAIENLLAKLEGVRQTKPGSYQARCCAHDDKSPSLVIKETPDGVILLRCFAGCSAAEIVAAAGLELSDLFPKSENFNHSQPGRPLKKPFSAADVLRALVNEVTIIAVCAGKLGHAGLTAEDSARLTLALQRVFNASAGVV
jgi:hypothetical protein